MVLELIMRQNKEDTMEISKNSCSCHLFSLSAVYKETFLHVMLLLNLKIMEDVRYPEQDRQSVSNMPKQIEGMGRRGLRNGMPHHGLCTEWVFQTKYCAVQ